MPSTATDFQITALSPQDVAFYSSQRNMGFHLCSASRHPNSCPHPVQFETSYSYITGAKRRRSISRRHLCLKHAKEFCARYQLALPDPAGVSQ